MTDSARGIQIACEVPASVFIIRSATDVLPLPGGPYRKSERPEAIAWPSWPTIVGLSVRSANARRTSSSDGTTFRIAWRIMALRYS
ncbi:MAG TPA: hypothetical protein PLI18_12605 [Pirellulaceae bacterium]|nr:hypothetical protein [Pirellulaceae bacterium]